MVSVVLGTVKLAENTQTVRVQFGEATTAGEAVYKKSDGKYWLADNIDITLGKVAGLACYDVAANGYSDMAVGGDIDLGATLVLATEYVLGSVAGEIHLHSDLATGEIYSRVGYGKTAALLTIDIANTEVVAP